MSEKTLITNQKTIYKNSGYVTYKLNNEIYFKIAELSYELFETEEFQYIFTPYYDVLDAFDDLEIPGLNLSLRKKEYHRVNMKPTFITERVIPENRFYLQEDQSLSKYTYYNPFEILLDSPMRYSGDNLFLKSDNFFKIDKDLNKLDIYKTTTQMLKILGARVDLTINNLTIDQTNRTILIKNYLYLYEKVKKYYSEKSLKGRKKIKTSDILLIELRKLHKNKIISIDDAIRRSNLKSKSTFYRRLKELETKNNKNSL